MILQCLSSIKKHGKILLAGTKRHATGYPRQRCAQNIPKVSRIRLNSFLYAPAQSYDGTQIHHESHRHLGVGLKILVSSLAHNQTRRFTIAQIKQISLFIQDLQMLAQHVISNRSLDRGGALKSLKDRYFAFDKLINNIVHHKNVPPFSKLERILKNTKNPPASIIVS